MIYCSFCGHDERQAKMLVAGPDCAICDDCTMLAYEIITDKAVRGNAEYDSWRPNAAPGDSKED
jgi:ATP-dependent Clp protease ATP-binding subunit ClpX